MEAASGGGEQMERDRKFDTGTQHCLLERGVRVGGDDADDVSFLTTDEK